TSREDRRSPIRPGSPAPATGPGILAPCEMPNEPLLFLSHSGVDTENARELKRRIESSPSARRVGLKGCLQANSEWISGTNSSISIVPLRRSGQCPDATMPERAPSPTEYRGTGK